MGDHPDRPEGSGPDVVPRDLSGVDRRAVEPALVDGLAQVEQRWPLWGPTAYESVASTVAVLVEPSSTTEAVSDVTSTGTARRPSTAVGGERPSSSCPCALRCPA